MSEYGRALRQVYGVGASGEPRCPHCGAMDLPAPAKPTLLLEQDGSRTCAQCGTNFRQEQRR